MTKKTIHIFMLLGPLLFLLGCSGKIRLVGELKKNALGIQKISFSSPVATITLNEKANVHLTLFLSERISEDATIYWNINGGETDFSPHTGSIQIFKGEETVQIDIVPIDDEIYELQKTFALDIYGDSTIFDNQMTINITLNDDDASILPAILTISDPLTGSTNITYENPSHLSVTNEGAAIAYCLIEQDQSLPDPLAPVFNDSCFQGSRPESVVFSDTGDRKIFLYSKNVAGQVSLPATDSINYQINLAPSVVGDGPLVIATSGGAETIDVLANDSDPEGGGLSIVAATSGSNGATVVITNGGTNLSYQPAASYIGVDTFTYTVQDDRGLQSVATVTMHVSTPFTWTGQAEDNSWNNNANWCGPISNFTCSGGGPPGGSDRAVFNSTCSNCNAHIDTTVNVDEIYMAPDFAGMITQIPGNTLSASGEGLVLKGGTFLGTSGDIVLRKYNQSGGSFVSTSDNLFITYAIASSCVTSTTDGFIQSGGIFNHNSGTTVFSGSILASGGCLLTGDAALIDINTSLSFYHLTIQIGDGSAYGGYNNSRLKLADGDTIIVEGDFLYTDGQLSGNSTIELRGNAYASCADGPTGERCALSGKTIFLKFAGNSTQTYRSESGAQYPNTIIDTTGSVSPFPGTTDVSLIGLDIRNGLFDAPSGILSIGTTMEHYCFNTSSGFLVGPQGTYNHNNGTLSLSGNVTWSSCSTYIKTIVNVDVDSSLILANLIIDIGDSNVTGGHNQSILTIQGNDRLVVLGDFAYTDGIVNGGEIEVHGNISITCADGNSGDNCARGGTSAITVAGSTQTQTIFKDIQAEFPSGILAINKPSGYLLSLSDIDLNAIGAGLNLSNGSWDLNGFNLDVFNALGLDSGNSIYLSGGILRLNSSLLPSGPYDNGTIAP